MKPSEIVHEFFPGADDGEVGFILWECTAFPFNSEEDLRGQIQELKMMLETYPGARLCDFCNRLALVENCCMSCHLAFTLDGSRLLHAATERL